MSASTVGDGEGDPRTPPGATGDAVADKGQTVIVVGGGIGGMAAALALAQRGYRVELLEQAAEIGEIGAGIQLGPNAFAAMDALGCGPNARSRSVYIDELVMMDAVDAREVVRLDVGESFRARFGNPYAVIHRADIHLSLYEVARQSERVTAHTSTRVERIEQHAGGVRVFTADARVFDGVAVIGCDGVRSVVRDALVDDTHRVSGHVVYRAVVPRERMPADLRWNAAALWAGPNCHLVHYPLRGGEQFNIVVTFHSREDEQWSVREGSRDEVMSYFEGIHARPRQLLELPTDWKRWATADRDPVEHWGRGRATLLGDAAHPTLQYMAQGACMAIEDAATLREALRVTGDDLEQALRLYESKRIVRTARLVLSSREMGRIYHARGAERLVRNSLWQGRSQQRLYDGVEWLYGWTVQGCLD